MGQAEFTYLAGGMYPVEANFAPMEPIGTNIKKLVRAFDDTTEEYANSEMSVPDDLDAAGTVTFEAWVKAKTAATSKNVELRLGHRPSENSEPSDPATPYTNVDSGDKAIDDTQDDYTRIQWTETISNLGWAAGDHLDIRISRIAPSANNLSGDMYLFKLVIKVPLA